MKKRKQHHVWKAYLRAWATNEKLWVLQDGRIRTADIADVAVQRDFYKLNALTPADAEFIRKYWIEPLHPSSRRVNENYLSMFSAWATMRENLSDAQAVANPAYVQFLEEQIVNAEEEFHSEMENRAAPLVQTARGGDISFYGKDDHAISFIHFLCVQHFRTSGMKRRVVERFKANLDIDISRCWNIMSQYWPPAPGAAYFWIGNSALLSC